MKKTNKITQMWQNCLEIIKSGDLELADEKIMEFIFKIGEYTMAGYKDSYKLEGVTIGVWKERSWMALQNAGLLPE